MDFYPDSEREEGPSWARPNWPVVALDDLNVGLDPTQTTIETVAAKAKEAAAASGASTPRSSRPRNDSICAMMLIRTYRVRGHLAADLDPLGLLKREMPADLTPEFHGFTGAALDRPIYLGGALGLEKATVREIVEILQAQLLRPCRPRIYAHLRRRGAALPPGPAGRPRGRDPLHPRGQAGDPPQGHPWRAMGEVPRPQICRHQALRPRRRRSHDPGARGGDQIWRRSSACARSCIGMSHRGRLNVLANVMAKPYRAIFSEFAGGSANPEDVGGSGDVKYHLGTSSDREFDGIKVHLSLRPQSKPSRGGRSGRARQGPRPADRLCAIPKGTGAAGPAPRRRGLRRPGHRLRMFRLLRHPRLQHRRLHPFRRQQPGRLHHLARSSPAPRLIRRTSPRRSRRRSSTSTATIPKR